MIFKQDMFQSCYDQSYIGFEFIIGPRSTEITNISIESVKINLINGARNYIKVNELNLHGRAICLNEFSP